jgi:RNA-directed DNA polymerase
VELGWFRGRGYRHFDNPMSVDDLPELLTTDNVAKHSFSPLIHQTAETKRYKPKDHKTVVKVRPLMYASHRDAAIFGFYSQQLNTLLSKYYDTHDLNRNVVAYRALGRANYDFSAEVYAFAKSCSPCTILAFDVTGFFDNLDHKRLKERIKSLLGVAELPGDWYNIFRALTKFRYVLKEDLHSNLTLKPRLNAGGRLRIATVAELKQLGIPLRPNGSQLSPARNPNTAGIPQGTPLSASISNAYMIEFDRSMKSFCDELGALYRRYSDDILVVCEDAHSSAVQAKVSELLDEEKLELSSAKTEVTKFDGTGTFGGRSAQYLGFTFHPDGAAVRPSSISRQARKIRRAVTKAKNKAQHSGEVLRTRKLRKRFKLIIDLNTGRPIRNFPAYARRSAAAFGPNEKVMRQSLRLERFLERQIAKAKASLL